MELFYIPNVTGNEVLLEDEQFKHAIRSLRKRQGDAIHFTDGQGVIYEGKIHEIEKHNATVHIHHRREVVPPEYNVTVCISLTKNMKRIEWALEKITEMGICRITPVICSRSERTTFNRNRLTKILVSAMKQSQQAFLPVLDDPTSIGKVIARYCDSEDDITYPANTSGDHLPRQGIFHAESQGTEYPISQDSIRSKDQGTSESDDSTIEIRKFIAYKSDVSISLKDNYRQGSDVVLLIGPEGDFTDEELELARKAGFIALSLGPNRLRTETAAVVAVAAVHTFNS
jgi:16S rRNA (uracil1498-N3)-methyltransferase